MRGHPGSGYRSARCQPIAGGVGCCAATQRGVGMTTSRTKLCTFFVDNQFFGIEVDRVQEIIRYQEMTRVPLAPKTIGGLLSLRGQIVITIDLRERLGFEKRPEGQLPMNVLVRSDTGIESLLIDEIGDVVEVDTDTFEPPPRTLKG